MSLGAIGNDPDDPGRELVTMLKELLDRLYPGIDWPLEWGNAICLRVSEILHVVGVLWVILAPSAKLSVVSAIVVRQSANLVSRLWTPYSKMSSIMGIRTRIPRVFASPCSLQMVPNTLFERTAPPSTEIPPHRLSVCGIPRRLNMLYVAPLSHTAEDLMSYQKPVGYLAAH
jgi:hypothetical protein